MTFEQCLRAGRVDAALAAIQTEVRSRPSDLELRSRLLALECVIGRWDKAENQLAALSSLDKSWLLPAQVYRSLLHCESLRREVFQGQAKPLVMGEPPLWMAWNIQGLAHAAQGHPAEAWELHVQAWEAAPEIAANVNGRSTPWLADSDRRLGPVLEAYLDGRYYWIPFAQIERWETKPPTTLLALVWLPAQIQLSGGASLSAHIPVRYPGTEGSQNGALTLARNTEWMRSAGAVRFPLGQRLLQGEGVDWGLLECRAVEFPASAAAETPL